MYTHKNISTTYKSYTLKYICYISRQKKNNINNKSLTGLALYNQAARRPCITFGTGILLVEASGFNKKYPTQIPYPQPCHVRGSHV